MIKFPGQYKLWRQTNISDVKSEVPSGGSLGELWSSVNIDPFENNGKIRLGKRLIVNTNSNNVAQLIGSPVGFRAMGNSGKIYTAAGANGVGYPFKTGTAGVASTFIKDTTSGAPSTCDSFYSDIELLNGQLFVTTKSLTVYYLNDTETTWNNFAVAGGGLDPYPHMLTTFASRMYFSYLGTKIISWDNAATPNVATIGAQYTLDLGGDASTGGTDLQIVWMRAASNRIWIGTINQNGGKGYIYTWDGSSNQATASYRLESGGALACVIKDDVPWIMDMYGNVLKWNGGTFVKVGALNMYNNRVLFNPLSRFNNRFVHPNGGALLSGQVSFLVDGRNYDGAYGPPDTWSILQTIPSGIWQYDADSSTFLHKHSITTTHLIDTPTIQDYGQTYLASTTTVNAVGAIAELLSSSQSAGVDGTFLAGATYSVDHSSSPVISAIFYDNNNDTTQKAGNFVTAKVYSPNVTDIWQKVFVVYRQFLASTDRIVLKYRVNDQPFTSAIVKFPTATTLTTATNPGAVGDEVEVIAGINAGICAHITSISLNAGLYTVGLDETFTVSATATSRVRFQSWIKLGNDINDQTSRMKERAIGIGNVSSNYIQFKVWMLWTGPDELDELIISNVPMQKA